MLKRSRASWVVSAGRGGGQPGDPLNVPPILASNFVREGDSVYSRGDGTATTAALETLVGGLEDGRALAFGSGMAAVSAVFDHLPVGSVVAIPDDCYQGVVMLCDAGAKQGRFRVQQVELADTRAWEEAALEADLLWLESPSNPLLTVADLPAICAAPRKPGAIVAVDNTFATPLNQRPLEFGADIVMHSATKFIGGHSDLLAGITVTNNDAIYEQLFERRTLGGAMPGAFETYLATRGARTMALRLERAQDNAAELARRLDDHAEVTVVRYPGLPAHPTHEVAKRTLDGYGAMLSFDTTGTAERATEVCRTVDLIHYATSLGGVESTMERRAVMGGQHHLPPTLLRLSVGCEDVDDLWADLSHALETTK